MSKNGNVKKIADESCEITVDGKASLIDPCYKAAGDHGPFATGYEFEATGVWVLTTTKMPFKSMGERNQTLNVKRTGAEFGEDAEWQPVAKVGVDAGLMSFYPEARGEIADWGGFCDELFEQEKDQRGHGTLREIQGIVVCSSGLGDGRYDVYARCALDGQIGEVEVDFTPSAGARALFGL